MAQKNRKSPSPLRLAAVLLMLVLVTTSVVTGRYAKYTTSASGSDSARVARFGVNQQSIKLGETDLTQSIPVPPIKPGDTETITVLVELDTEVAVKNTVTIENTYSNLPLTFNVNGTGSSTCSEVCVPGNDEKTYNISITWPKSADSAKYIGMVDLLTVRVVTEQVD